MKILSYNAGHDGAVAYLEDGELRFSIEAEKDSSYRYSPVSSHDVFDALGELKSVPDVIATGGWWPREHRLFGPRLIAPYRGTAPEFIVEDRSLFGHKSRYFSASHERGHILCAYGMSALPTGTPCYALVWEGAIGAFYEVDADVNISLLANVLNQPGNRYASIYGLADPTFPKNAPFSRFTDAGKLMALASFSKRAPPSKEDRKLIDFLLNSEDVSSGLYQDLRESPYFDVGLDDPCFRNFAGLFSDEIFERFHRFAKTYMRKELPLLISGGCGLNCDWNAKWLEAGIFPEIFVPPVANDSGAALGAAIDAQLYFTGNPKIEWSVYSGREFVTDRQIDRSHFDQLAASCELVAEMLMHGLVLGWVNGKYEIGPRALGNRSILAAPFDDATRVRLNEIKKREPFRPIAPVCLDEDAATWFGCHRASPFMLYTQKVTTKALAAVTHVNGTARIQTVSRTSNPQMHELLVAFKRLTGYGVLCNTSLNFNGRGFINRIGDLADYTLEHGLDGFIVDGKAYLSKTSISYKEFLANNTEHALC